MTAASDLAAGDGLSLDERVVLLEDPPLTGHVRGREHGDQRLVEVALERDERRVVDGLCHVVGRQRPFVLRAVVRERGGRQLRDDLALVPDREHVAGNERCDHGRCQAPLLAHRTDVGEPLGRDDREHPLLRLGRQDLERLQPALPKRHGVQVEIGSHAGARGRFADRARDAGRAQVLQPFQQSRLDHLERRLDQELARERVTDLDGRTRALRAVLERGAGEHRCSADAVAPGRRAEQDQR